MFFYLLVAIVYFKNSISIVNESSGLVQLTLVLTNALSSDVDVEVIDEPGNSTGESLDM